MARIRTVKPELFQHSDLYDAEKDSGLPLRLSFIALFTCCDREGRFRWRPRELKVACLPYDEVDFSRVLDALTTRGFLVRYASPDGSEYGCIPSFTRHQVINNRETASSYPSPTDAGVVTRQPRVMHASATRDAREKAEGKGREGEQEGKGKGREEEEPIGSVAEPVMDLDVEKKLQDEQPDEARARVDRRDPEITELVEFASAKLRDNGVPGGLDSDWIKQGNKRIDGNRAAAKNIMGKLAKDYPDHRPLDSAKHLVEVALRDPFHKANFTRLSYLYRHMTAIIQNHKNPRNHGQQSAADKFTGALEILQSGALSGGLFAGSSPYSEPEGMRSGPRTGASAGADPRADHAG